eukprot:6468546-Amphidinium_carterae.4
MRAQVSGLIQVLSCGREWCLVRLMSFSTWVWMSWNCCDGGVVELVKRFCGAGWCFVSQRLRCDSKDARCSSFENERIGAHLRRGWSPFEARRMVATTGRWSEDLTLSSDAQGQGDDEEQRAMNHSSSNI